MPSIIRSPRAKSDLFQIWDYINSQNPPAADRVLNQIDEACKKLSIQPHSGTSRDDLSPNLRFYPVGNYLIFYKPTDDGIDLVRVIHGARNYIEEFK